MDPTTQTQLIRFLQEDLAVPTDSLEIALRHQEYRGQLPMILWRYGLVTLEQLDQIFEWLETASPLPHRYPLKPEGSGWTRSQELGVRSQLPTGTGNSH